MYLLSKTKSTLRAELCGEAPSTFQYNALADIGAFVGMRRGLVLVDVRLSCYDDCVICLTTAVFNFQRVIADRADRGLPLSPYHLLRGYQAVE